MKAVNLIPSEQRRGASVGAGRSGGAAYILLGALGVLAVLLLLYGMARHQVSDRKVKLASVNAQTQRIQQSATALSAYTSFQTLRDQRTQAVEAVVDSRFDWAHELHELGRVLPHDASITTLDGSVGGTSGSGAASPTTSGGTGSATPPGTVPTITLGGCASSQADVALTLQRLRLIDGVASVSLQSSTKSANSPTSGSNCVAGAPTFTATITFDPLPTPTSKGSSGTELAASTGGTK
jgi:Tfp pilus assembly protein PilN